MRTRIGPGARRRSRGQGLVEFSLVAPMLFILILGILEAGRFIFYTQALNYAAREGARYAIVNGENSFNGCPSGPIEPSSDHSDCDPTGNRVRTWIEDTSFGVAGDGGLTFGWPGDEAFLTYTLPDGGSYSCRDNMPHTVGCNRQGYNVTVRLEYTYSPMLDLGLIPVVTIRAETTLVINN